MFQPNRLNRFATLATFVLVAVAVFVGVRATSGSGAPAFEPEGLLVVANLREESLTLFDFEARTRREIALEGPPHEMVATGHRLFVTLGRADLLAEVDLAAGAVTRYLTLPGHPHGIALGEAGLYVTLDDADEVLLFDPDSLAEVHSWPTGDTPHSLAVLGATAFVTNTREGTVSAIGRTTATREAGALPESIAVLDGRTVVAGNAEAGTLSLFGLPGFDGAGTVAVGGWPVRLAQVGDHLLVARNRAGDVLVLDASFETVASVATGTLTDGLCVSPSGSYVAALANGDSRLVVIEAASWAEAARYDTGDGPGACAWLPSD